MTARVRRKRHRLLTFIGTNPTDELITGMPVIRQKTDDSYIRFTIGEHRKSEVLSQCRTRSPRVCAIIPPLGSYGLPPQLRLELSGESPVFALLSPAKGWAVR
jgi:hypothetical protein